MTVRWLERFFLVVAMLFAAGALPAQQNIEIRKVADGLYAALQPAALRFDDANTAIILLDDGVLVVDTQDSPVTARAVLDEIRKLTDKPVRYVVNTHWHSDHVQGNAAYRAAFPEALFIAHKYTREDIAARAIPDHREQMESLPPRIAQAEEQLAKGRGLKGQPLNEEEQKQQRKSIERAQEFLAHLREVQEFVLPTLTFEDRLTLHRAGREIRLLHFGGHTRGDVVLFLPKERVLISGDLLDDLPYTGHGSPAALVATLKELSQLDFDCVIPGHGGVKQGREHLNLVLSLFESLVAQVQEAVRAGLSLEETQKKVNLEKFRAPLTRGDEVAIRYWDGFIPEAVARAYNEALGKKTP